MISCLARFMVYLEVNGGPPIGASLSNQVARLELQVKAQFVLQKTTMYNHPVKGSIWDLLLNITTTIAQSPAPTTLVMYKSVIQNQTATTIQSKSDQYQTAATTSSKQQRQQ